MTTIMTDHQLNERLAALRMKISEIRDLLPYADGPAYYNDKAALNALNREMVRVQAEIQARKDANNGQA